MKIVTLPVLYLQKHLFQVNADNFCTLALSCLFCCYLNYHARKQTQ